MHPIFRSIEVHRVHRPRPQRVLVQCIGTGLAEGHEAPRCEHRIAGTVDIAFMVRKNHVKLLDDWESPQYGELGNYSYYEYL